MTHEEAERYKIARDLRHKASKYSGLRKRVYSEAAAIIEKWALKDVDIFIKGFLHDELERREKDNE